MKADGVTQCTAQLAAAASHVVLCKGVECTLHVWALSRKQDASCRTAAAMHNCCHVYLPSLLLVLSHGPHGHRSA